MRRVVGSGRTGGGPRGRMPADPAPERPIGPRIAPPAFPRRAAPPPRESAVPARRHRWMDQPGGHPPGPAARAAGRRAFDERGPTRRSGTVRPWTGAGAGTVIGGEGGGRGLRSGPGRFPARGTSACSGGPQSGGDTLDLGSQAGDCQQFSEIILRIDGTGRRRSSLYPHTSQGGPSPGRAGRDRRRGEELLRSRREKGCRPGFPSVMSKGSKPKGTLGKMVRLGSRPRARVVTRGHCGRDRGVVGWSRALLDEINPPDDRDGGPREGRGRREDRRDGDDEDGA